LQTFIALLRGVNVGGKNMISMSELRPALAASGLEHVTTYLQSGNVIFRSSNGARQLADDIEQEIARVFGANVAVFLRNPAELERIAAHNPLLGDEAEPTKLHVVFLDAEPTAKAAAELDPNRSPPDRFSVSGREIYLHLPSGAGRSKLTIDYFERQLAVRATARNWRTLTKLIELARQS
jgi:uncharacterized protein (DUF1697 family)